MNCNIINGNALEALKTLPGESVQTCITSPPYFGLRDYGIGNQIGLENSLQEYIAKLVEVFREVKRVLRKDGTLWLNLGDSYANDKKWGGSTGGKHAGGLHGQTSIGREKRNTGFKSKDLMMMPHRVAIALQEDGWFVRQTIIWHKLNPLPESVKDRCTNAHEYIFLLTKAPHYFFDAEAIAENVSPNTHARISKQLMPNRTPREGADTRGGNQGTDGLPIISPKSLQGDSQMGVRNNSSWASSTLEILPKRNKRSVWATTTEANKEAHFATFPQKLIEPCVLAGTSERGCCANCGSLFYRIFEKGFTSHNGTTKTAYEKGMAAKRLALLRQAARENGEEYSNNRKTSGWEKSCKCETDEVKPCTILDPFSGTGTTGIVALKHKRNYIGIEINPDYVEMSKRRLSELQIKLF